MPTDTYNGQWSAEKRDRRQYAANRDNEIERALRDPHNQGSLEEILGSLGIRNVKEGGQAKYRQYTDLLRNSGPASMGTMGQYDWVNGKKWDPLKVTAGYAAGERKQSDPGDPSSGNTGAWVDISPEEYKSKQLMDKYRAQYGDNFNPYRLMEMEKRQRMGDITQDKASGLYYNDVNNDPNHREWFDSQYNMTKAPTGFNPSLVNTGAGVGGTGVSKFPDGPVGIKPPGVVGGPSGVMTPKPVQATNPYTPSAAAVNTGGTVNPYAAKPVGIRPDTGQPGPQLLGPPVQKPPSAWQVDPAVAGRVKNRMGNRMSDLSHHPIINSWLQQSNLKPLAL